MVKRLWAIVGMAGAGKSEVSKFFSSKNIPVLRFGDQTDIGVKELGLPLTEENERKYREQLRADLGMAAQAIKIHPRIEKEAEQSSFIVLDGLYSWEERQYLKKVYPILQLLCVYAPPEIRYERLSNRKIRPLTRDEAISRDMAEIENLNKGGPIAMADMLVDNSTTTIELNAQLERIYIDIT